MMYRLVMTVFVLFALTPALAGARLATEGAPLWLSLIASILFPAGALVIGVRLARWHNGRA
ncbi:hypothetical protein [Actinomadura hibisca]|uniref:hypothetical protein n=1 Tax=Actinomadura hibisca TaxID=68565 RepID=UPI0008369F59|nr:hypothetical protein [Actinomadura hibisca]